MSLAILSMLVGAAIGDKGVDDPIPFMPVIVSPQKYIGECQVHSLLYSMTVHVTTFHLSGHYLDSPEYPAHGIEELHHETVPSSIQ